MNDRYFPTAQDENVILITAEFYEAGRKLKYDRKNIHMYELDLIVSADITLEQLLDAIDGGLRRKLSELYHVDPEKMSGNAAYDELHSRYEQMMQDSANFHGRKAADWSYRSSEGFRTERTAEVQMQMRESDPAPAAEEAELWRWLICWNVFDVCRMHYARGYPEYPINKIRKAFRIDLRPSHPVIACGGIDLRSWDEKSFLSLTPKKQIWLDQKNSGSKTLRQLGFLTSSRLIFDPIAYHSGGALIEEREIAVPIGETFPSALRTNRPAGRAADNCIRIKAPNPPPDQSHCRIWTGIASAAVGIPMLGGLWLTLGQLPLSQQTDLAIFWVAFGAWCAMTVLLSRRFANRNLVRWCSNYETYIRTCIEQIRQMQHKDVQLMRALYPPVYDPVDQQDLIGQACSLSGGINSRRPDHKDFLYVRVGLTTEGSHVTPSHFEIRGDMDDAAFSAYRYQNIRGMRGYPFRILLPGEPSQKTSLHDGTLAYLSELPQDLAKFYGYLDNAPVMLDLNRTRTAGFLYQDGKKGFGPLIRQMVMDLCFHHSPEDVQFVMFCPQIKDYRSQQDFIRPFKHLPHFQHLLQDRSPFLFSREQAKAVMDRLLQIHNGLQGQHQAHIILLVMEDYGLRRHPLAELLPKTADGMTPADNSLTFVFFTHFASMLPAYCNFVVKRDMSNRWFYIPYSSEYMRTADPLDLWEERQYEFTADPFVPGEGGLIDSDSAVRMSKSMKILSALYHQTTVGDALPTRYDLITLLRAWNGANGQIPEEEHTNVFLQHYAQQCWEANDGADHLMVPIGAGQNGAVVLELDGSTKRSHLLVTGSDRSGKTEALITVVFGLCIHYSPERVKMMLVDVDDTGILHRLGSQPHILETIDLGTGDPVSNWNRVMELLRQQIEERMQLLAWSSTRDIRAYNRIAGKRADEAVRMPELVVVLDHYEKLPKLLGLTPEELDQNILDVLEQADRCGIHLLLAIGEDSGGPTDALLEQLQIRLCLMLTDNGRSTRIIGSEMAASVRMPGAGRAYLHEADTGATDRVQVALCTDAGSADHQQRVQVTYMNHAGRYELFFDSEDRIKTADGNEQPTQKRYAAEKTQHITIPRQAMAEMSADPGAAAAVIQTKAAGVQTHSEFQNQPEQIHRHQPKNEQKAAAPGVKKERHKDRVDPRFDPRKRTSRGSGRHPDRVDPDTMS